MENNIKNVRAIVKPPGGPAIQELPRNEWSILGKIRRLIEDEYYRNEHKNIEGRSIVEIVSSPAGYIGKIYCQDGSKGETPPMPTRDSAVCEARWRSRAWHDEPIMKNSPEAIVVLAKMRQEPLAPPQQLDQVQVQTYMRKVNGSTNGAARSIKRYHAKTGSLRYYKPRQPKEISAPA